MSDARCVHRLLFTLITVIFVLASQARPAAGKALHSSTQAVDRCKETVSALKAASTANSVTQVQAYRAAAEALRELEKTTADVKEACRGRLKGLEEARNKGSRVLLAAAVDQLKLATDEAKIKATNLVNDAIVLDPTYATTAAARGALAETSPCVRARELRTRQRERAEALDQAEALLAELVASGDDATVACAKRERAELAVDRADASNPRGVVERLGAQSLGSVVPVLLGSALALLVAFVLWRLMRIAFPPPPATIRRHRRWRGWYAGTGLTAAAVSVGALVSLYLRESWPVTLSPDRRWWIIGLVWVIVAATAGPRLMKDSWSAALRWAAWTWLPLAAVVGFAAAAGPEWARQWLGVAAGIVAVVFLALWAGSKLRLSFHEFKGGTNPPAGFAGAVAAGLVSLGEEAPRGVVVVGGTDQTQLPTDKLGELPGGKWAAALLAVWRTITPSGDLVVTGDFLEEEGGEQGVVVHLRRGRRVESSVLIESRLFASPGGNLKAEKLPDKARTAAWHDLATAAAAWLLHELRTLTDEGMQGLAGASRWQSTALNAVAAHRQDEGQGEAALALLLHAISLDPGNLAAQYGRLALEAQQIDGTGPGADRRYESTSEALEGLSLQGHVEAPLMWRCAYMVSATRANAVKAAYPGDLTATARSAAGKAAEELGELIKELKLVTEEKNWPLAKELLGLSRPACLGAALLAGAEGDTVRDAVRNATAGTRPSLELGDRATHQEICVYIDEWLSPKESDLLAPRAAYNAACSRALMDQITVEEGGLPPRKLEALLRRAFQDHRVAIAACSDPFLGKLHEQPWYQTLLEDFDVDGKPTGLAAFAAVGGYTEALADAGITTLKELRDHLLKDDGPKRLAMKLGLQEEQVLTWQSMLDLWIPSDKEEPLVPIETINLLAAVGIDSRLDLSRQGAAELRIRLSAARRALGADVKPPEVTELKRWIDEAKNMKSQPSTLPAPSNAGRSAG